VIVNVLNPKRAVLFFGFLPQFVDPSRGRVGRQVLALGAGCVALGVATAVGANAPRQHAA
jgi:threonine/homoserine/homoserine lactone efflux protein